MSPFNSFFTPQTIRLLVAWASARFDRVEVMLYRFTLDGR
ncbi:tRNA-dependent cyclodipeptide synthase [Streptomyces sp. NPDC047525]